MLSSLQTGALAEVMKSFTRAFGSERLLLYEPFNYEPLKAAHQQLFSLPLIPSYRLDSCDFIISCGADFLDLGIPGLVRGPVCRHARLPGGCHHEPDFCTASSP